MMPMTWMATQVSSCSNCMLLSFHSYCLSCAVVVVVLHEEQSIRAAHLRAEGVLSVQES
jgi:hypothetical protein